MSRPTDCGYTKEHEWAKDSGTAVAVGITDYAQQELGDVVFVDLPEVGQQVRRGESFMTVESVKAVSDIYAPVDGEVVEVNSQLADSPELVNQAPFEGGWMVRIKATDKSQLSELLSLADYTTFLSEISK